MPDRGELLNLLVTVLRAAGALDGVERYRLGRSEGLLVLWKGRRYVLHLMGQVRGGRLRVVDAAGDGADGTGA
jgi:hypothetical protein